MLTATWRSRTTTRSRTGTDRADGTGGIQAEPCRQQHRLDDIEKQKKGRLTAPLCSTDLGDRQTRYCVVVSVSGFVVCGVMDWSLGDVDWGVVDWSLGDVGEDGVDGLVAVGVHASNSVWLT